MKNKSKEKQKNNVEIESSDNLLKYTKNKLNEIEEKFRNIIMNLDEGYFSTAIDGTVLEHNPALNRILGFDVNIDLKGFSFSSLWENKEDRLAYIKKLLVKGSISNYQIKAKTRQGTPITLMASAHLINDEYNQPQRIEGIFRDITKIKLAENYLRASEEKYRTLVQNIQDGIFIIKDGKILYANEVSARELNYRVDELIGKSMEEIIAPEDLAMVTDYHARRMRGEDVRREYDFKVVKKDGVTRVDVRISVGVINYEGGPAVLITGKDITERVKVEEKLRKSEENYRHLFDNSPAAIYKIDYKTGRFIKANDAFCRYVGCSQEEITSLSAFDILTEKSKKLFMERLEKISQGIKVSEIVELEAFDRKGKQWCFQLHIKNIYDTEGNVAAADVVAHDITERKRMEDELQKSEKKYHTIFENALEGIYQVTPEGKFITANTTLARMAGYDSSEEFKDSIKDIRNQLYVNHEDRDRFLKIIQTQGLVKGFEVQWFKKDGNIFWVVLNALAVKDEQGKILYNEGLVEDITIRKQAEEQLKYSLESLGRAVGTTINVLVSALESRDPYTAGHQTRTANLACAIAMEMGLDKDKIEGINMAGIIHDIGKLSIPAEILTKPTKLTDIEFSLVKEHAQGGYEMLKQVESPWPLAEIVHQHHERMNGNGYPRSLKGDDIIIEARILGVADVVEAMASDRPYRASLGIDLALEEIEKNKNILYDETVADACMSLFRGKGYQLS